LETINDPSFMNPGRYHATGVRHFRSSNLICCWGGISIIYPPPIQ